MKRRMLKFRWLPASWGLEGDAYKIAEAHYLYDGEDLDRRLAQVHYKDDKAALDRANLDIDRRYGRIDDYHYDCRKAELEAQGSTDAFMLRKIDIDVAHQRISPYEAARQKVMLGMPDGDERELALLKISHDFNRLDRHSYEKQCATLKKEPWIAIINSGFDPDRGIDGVFFEFDWNEHWIAFLKQNGYDGFTDEQVVDDWFTDVCRSHSAAELAGSLVPSRNLHMSD